MDLIWKCKRGIRRLVDGDVDIGQPVAASKLKTPVCYKYLKKEEHTLETGNNSNTNEITIFLSKAINTKYLKAMPKKCK